MPKAHYLEQMPSDVTIGLRNFIDWLTGTTRGITNGGAGTAASGWTVIEADDQTVREGSGDGTLAGLSGGNLWRTGASLPLHAWCVVQGTGTYGQPIQFIAWVRDNTQRIAFQMIPLADWATGGGSSSSPTLPATIVPATHEDSDSLVTNGWLFAVADEGVCVLGYDGISTPDQHLWHIGEVDSPDLTADTRPFIFWNDPNNPLGTESWWRLSPVDDLTLIGGPNDGERMAFMPWPSSDSWLNTSSPAMVAHGGNRQEFTAGCRFVDSGHDHVAGILRYLTVCHSGLGTRGTVTPNGGDPDSRLFISRSDFEPGILMDWDGTSFP